MSGSLNKAIVIGYVGRKPVIATSVNGKRYAKFSVATEERLTDQFGNQQQLTQWHNVMIWGEGADLVARSVHKGSRVMVEGRLETSAYQDRNTGQQRSYTKISAREIVPLNENPGNGGQSYTGGFGPGMYPGYQNGYADNSGSQVVANPDPSEIEYPYDCSQQQEPAGEYDEDENEREGPDQAMQALREIYYETGDGSLLTELEGGCV